VNRENTHTLSEEFRLPIRKACRNQFTRGVDQSLLSAAGYPKINTPDAEINENIQFLLDIAFNEPGIAESESIVDTIQRAADVGDNLIADFGPLL
jgi:hypothetical protein